jgi:hypothetical protein
MPNAHTFEVAPIGGLIRWHLAESDVSVDPFARNNRWATHTNDLNPATLAEHHLEALEFLELLHAQDVVADLVLFDPPYSPRQIAECYQSIGLVVNGMEATQASRWAEWKRGIAKICKAGSRVISCGWNTNGIGIGLGFEIEEILLVAHGGWHNDTIVTVERRVETPQGVFEFGGIA